MTASVDFAQTAAAVFGDAVDVEGLLSEIAKMNPGPEAVHSPGVLGNVGVRPQTKGALHVRRKRVAKRATPEQKAQRAEMERKVAQVSNVVGLAAGTAGTATAVQAYRASKKPGAEPGPVTGALARRLKVSPRAAGRLTVLGAGGALGLQAGNVVGDAVTARVLGRSKESVDKGFKDLVRGMLKVNRQATATAMPAAKAPMRPVGPQLDNAVARSQPSQKLSPTQAGRAERKAAAGTQARAAQGALRPTAGPKPSVAGAATTAKAPIDWAARGAGAKADIGTAMGTGTGKIVAGTAAASVGSGMLKRRGEGSGYDPYAAYSKSATGEDNFEFYAPIAKFDDEKRLAFGWASVVRKNGLPVLDRQGDYIAIDDVEDAAYTYVEKSRVGGHMHKRTMGKADGEDAPHHVADMVESMVFTPEKIAKMDLPADFPTGWWVGYRVFDDDVWADAKSGKLTGFSIHGKGIRKSVDYDDVMGS